jgi:hypothetical protein
MTRKDLFSNPSKNACIIMNIVIISLFLFLEESIEIFTRQNQETVLAEFILFGPIAILFGLYLKNISVGGGKDGVIQLLGELGYNLDNNINMNIAEIENYLGSKDNIRKAVYLQTGRTKTNIGRRYYSTIRYTPAKLVLVNYYMSSLSNLQKRFQIDETGYEDLRKFLHSSVIPTIESFLTCDADEYEMQVKQAVSVEETMFCDTMFEKIDDVVASIIEDIVASNTPSKLVNYYTLIDSSMSSLSNLKEIYNITEAKYEHLRQYLHLSVIPKIESHPGFLTWSADEYEMQVKQAVSVEETMFCDFMFEKIEDMVVYIRYTPSKLVNYYMSSLSNLQKRFQIDETGYEDLRKFLHSSVIPTIESHPELLTWDNFKYEMQVKKAVMDKERFYCGRMLMFKD